MSEGSARSERGLQKNCGFAVLEDVTGRFSRFDLGGTRATKIFIG